MVVGMLADHVTSLAHVHMYMYVHVCTFVFSGVLGISDWSPRVWGKTC